MPDEENTIADAIGEQVANTIETTIENAEVRAEHAAEVNELIIDAALEGERGKRIEALERRLDEWQNNQTETQEAIASIVLGLTELTGKVDLLAAQSIPAQPVTPLDQSEVDGQRESREEIPEQPEEPVAETPPPQPAPAPKKKKRNWI